MIVTIHQPDHMGYLGFYHKIMNANMYVILDIVQFAKREFIHRNRIRGANGAMWLSVPVLTKGRYHQKIQDVEINQNATTGHRVLSGDYEFSWGTNANDMTHLHARYTFAVVQVGDKWVASTHHSSVRPA